jgi:uncharacterized membrane protein YsdA (DUF1294 family)
MRIFEEQGEKKKKKLSFQLFVAIVIISQALVVYVNFQLKE